METFNNGRLGLRAAVQVKVRERGLVLRLNAGPVCDESTTEVTLCTILTGH